MTEKILREAPRLSWTLTGSYNSNLQERDSYQNMQSSVFFVSPRYRLNDKFMIIGSTGLQQAMADSNLNFQNRTDFTNTSIGISRNPFPVGKYGDMRLTTALVLPSNQFNRENQTFNGALRGTVNYFVRTNSNFVWDVDMSALVNNHTYSIDFRGNGNVQYSVTPFQDIGFVFAKHWQFIAYQAYTSAWDYRGERRGFFTFDESLTYAKSRRWNASLGVTNAGSILKPDGQNSNVALFDTRTTTLYVQGSVNL